MLSIRGTIAVITKWINNRHHGSIKLLLLRENLEYYILLGVLLAHENIEFVSNLPYFSGYLLQLVGELVLSLLIQSHRISLLKIGCVRLQKTVLIVLEPLNVGGYARCCSTIYGLGDLLLMWGGGRHHCMGGWLNVYRGLSLLDNLVQVLIQIIVVG